MERPLNRSWSTFSTTLHVHHLGIVDGQDQASEAVFLQAGEGVRTSIASRSVTPRGSFSSEVSLSTAIPLLTR